MLETHGSVPDRALAPTPWRWNRGFSLPCFTSVCDTLADVVTPVLSLSPPLISMYFPSSSPFAHEERGLSALCSFLTIYVGQGQNRLNLPGSLRPEDKMRAERMGIDGRVQIYSPLSLSQSLSLSLSLAQASQSLTEVWPRRIHSSFLLSFVGPFKIQYLNGPLCSSRSNQSQIKTLTNKSGVRLWRTGRFV